MTVRCPLGFSSRGDKSFWAQVYERVREIEQVHGLRVKSISITER